MRAGVLAATALSLCFSLLAAAPSQAQAPSPAAPQAPPPLTGFMPPYEITRIVRSAGFDPVAPPLREGTTYVLRATDFRGILMRVVVDARSGAIRAVNRIVPGPGPYGQIGMVAPPYGVAPAYPPEMGGADMAPDEAPFAPAPPSALAAPPPPAVRPGAHPSLSQTPLPRPRPTGFAARKAADDATTGTAPAVNPAATAGAAGSGPAAVPVAPSKSPPPPVPLND